MAIGIIGGGSGRGTAYIDFDITLTAKTGDASNWVLESDAGTNCYTQTVLTADISPNVYIDEQTDVTVLPNLEKITQWGLEQFAWLNAVESTATGIKFYSMTGCPSFDIPLTLRIMK